MGSFFFDADGDGYPDLLVTGGSDEFSPGSPVYIPRLFMNDGKGHFTFKPGAIPATVNTSACVITGTDFDGDGNMDLFIGGRVSSSFPISPRSYILRNEHGIFKDVTEEVCPALISPGMVTAAVWTDFDNDHKTDLVIAGEWMPVRFFKNTGRKLEEVTASTGLTGMSGQWRSLIAVDVDKDGDMDFVAGNLGSNNRFHVTPEQPLMLYAADLDNNGILDPVTFYYIKDRKGQKQLYPAISRDQFAGEVPSIKKKFLYYKDYGTALFTDIYPEEMRKDLLTLKCEETRSCWFENLGNGKFIKHPLPVEAQFAPVNAIVCDDLDGDGNNDLILAGNEYQTEPMTGRYDASYGLFLKGDVHHHFIPVPSQQSGLLLQGDVKDLREIRTAEGDKLILVGINDDSMKVFKVNHIGK